MVERFVYTETVNGSSPLLPKIMFYYIWLKVSFFVIFIFFTLIGFLYLNLYLNLFKIGIILYWKLFYLFILSLSLLTLFFTFSDEIIINFLVPIKEIIIMRDPQDYINLNINLVFFYTFLFFCPVFIIYCWLYNINTLEKKQANILNVFVFYILIIYITLFWIVKNDLYLSNWDFFYFNNVLHYDFQPDMLLLFLIFFGEYIDLLFYLLFYCFIQIITIKLIFNFWYKNAIYFNRLRIFLNVIIFMFSFYFFGGETWNRMLFLFIFVFLMQETFFFIMLFFSFIKLKI
jgi:hypothetical protein